MNYNYYVSYHNDGRIVTTYNGTDAADAMAAWSQAVSEGVEYVFLEALKELPR